MSQGGPVAAAALALALAIFHILLFFSAGSRAVNWQESGSLIYCDILPYCKQNDVLFHRPVFGFTLACACFILSQLILLCWSGRLKWLKTDYKTAIEWLSV